ncbi:MAG TPA: hypothetical protein VIK04_06295, partial [Solirubrobacteraceae bacterium]
MIVRGQATGVAIGPPLTIAPAQLGQIGEAVVLGHRLARATGVGHPRVSAGERHAGGRRRAASSRVETADRSGSRTPVGLMSALADRGTVALK